MAQTLQQLESRESSSSYSENKPPSQPQPQQAQSNLATISGSKIRIRPAASQAKLASTDSAPNKSTAIASSSIPPTPSTLSENTSNIFNTPIFNRHQPSKIFVTRCRTELEALLNSIKDKYHEEIKSLNSIETIHADFFVEIGEEFKKPLHKCIIASRAFKLYNVLKAFELVEVPVEEDIIISEFQDKISENKPVELSGDSKEADKSRPETPTEEGATAIKEEPIASLHCHLPDNLISPELFLNFVRLVYIDQDVCEQEIKLYQTLIDWLKQNKPELIKAPTRNQHSPDHRISFRTVQPLFEETHIDFTKSTVMSANQNILHDLRDVDIEINADDLDETSQATSPKDESLTSSLTRTETFELISRNNPGSPTVVVGTPNKIGQFGSSNASNDENEEDEKAYASSESSNTCGSNTPTIPYAPTTRTGLKPKTFTTPTNLRPTPRSSTPKMNSSATKPSSNSTIQTAKSIVRADDSSKMKPQGSNVPKVASAGKQQAPTAAKRSSLSTSNNQTEDSPSDVTQTPKISGLVNKVKNQPAVGASTKGGKLTSIARAHPISLERSQSPNTSVMNKGSGRNFIAANKRLVSQIEKKHTQNDSPLGDSEAENSDQCSLGLEPLTTDNLVAQLDKFALVSQSKLADALSRLFIDGTMSDTVLLVKDGKQINAHKCILAARSAYLAEVLDKQCRQLQQQQQQQQQQEQEESTESDHAGNIHDASATQKLKIDITEYSYPAVYFSILHIYSGIVKVPDDLDLEELTRLTNQLHITTLRQVCMHNLRMNYCHYFHKPCNVCCVGVLKTLPLAWRYDYTELYSKCLQWIGSHFASIFCLKEFSELKPHDLLEECYTATLSQLTPDNVITKTIECQKLLKNLPRVKWTESIICLVGRQLEDFCHYVADNYEKILQSECFLNLGKNCWECEVLEENLLAAMNHLKPDSGCKTLIQLHKIECSMESLSEDPRNVSDSFANLVSKMRKYCERYLLKEAAAVVHCSSWRHMNPSLQKRIKDQAIITTDFDEPDKQLASKPKLISSQRNNNNHHHQQRQSISPSSQLQNSSSDGGAKSPSNRSTPESRLKSPSTTYLPPPKSKAASARYVKVLK